jgi:hypothetical protein
MGIYELLVILTVILLGVAGTVFWAWALIDCIRNEPEGSQDRLLWALVILFSHLVGAVLYVIIRRPKRKAPA